MKNLHIQNMDKFIEPYINFINKYFNPDSHLFAVITSNKDKVFKSRHKNIHYIYKSFSSLLVLINFMYKAERIFLHGLFNSKIIFLLFLQPWLLKKCYWIVWGGDLYKYRESKVTFKQKGGEFVRRFVIKNMSELLPIVEGDFKLAQRWYNTKARYRYNAVYVNNLEVINLVDFNTSKENNDDEIKLLIGNSATESNNHEEIFDKLSKFKEKHIRLFVPLSYGDEAYADKVISKGEEIFGEKLVPLTKFMNKTDYIKFLNTMDAGIFNNDRQQAMGNIYLLLYLGKKIFVKEGTTMWEELNKKYYVSSVRQLDDIDLNWLNELDEKKQSHNIEKASSRYNVEKAKAAWKKIFED
ncbi:TDP-N-acetylfucosamine:lipid II N-acetylfucosaminyltransferase [Virgibacillus siamensis]|uniref:TDP-N-acetylfucosamine:lipid II N-acetylfucosaminyltransferase n=1 Tax=Virgibacillus siamensis TaxID=480071 RepID=A0ABP3RF95_9BACI